MSDFEKFCKAAAMNWAEWKPALIGGALLAAPVHYVEKYLFSDWQFIGSLMVLVVLDTLTGIWKHWTHNTISSKGFGQFCKKLILYGCVLIVTHTLISFRVQGEPNVIFSWIDTIVYSAIIVREALSIFENVAAIYPDLLPAWLLKKLRDFDSTGHYQHTPQEQPTPQPKPNE